MKPGRPTATITIDGRQLTAPEAALARLEVTLSTAGHDTADMSFWPQTKFASSAAGSAVTIALGSDGNDRDVLTGEVSSVAPKAATVEIGAVSATVALNRSRKSQVYLSSTVEDVVRDLAGSVSIDQVQADLQLDAYCIDTRRTAWGLLLDLALLCGAEVGSSASGGLRFVPVSTGPAAHTFRFGADVLDWEIASAKPVDAPAIAPHGAGSVAGSSHWHWLLRDPLGAGSPPGRVVGAFHTQDAADQLQSALSDSTARAGVRGRICMVGDASVRPGELVEVTGLPSGDSGTLRVLQVHHGLDCNGFLTTLFVEGAGASAGPS